MIFEPIMQIIGNQPGKRPCYCWNRKVLLIASVDGWQDVIYGYYHKGKLWCLGIKRNEVKSGHFYQVVAPSMAQLILREIEKCLPPNETGKKIIKMILRNYDGTPNSKIIDEIEVLLAS